MTDIHQRLANCFSNVFPDIQPDEISRASISSLVAWDSVTHLILLSAVAEEFGFELTVEEFGELVSFALIEADLETRVRHG